MNVIVFGASGGIGQWVVKKAAEHGHTVSAVIRSSSDYDAPAGVDVIRGEVTDLEFVQSVVADHSVIISCIGIRRVGKSPWARIQSPSNLVETVTRNMIHAATCLDDTRLIWISAAGVGDSRELCSPLIKKMITLGNIGLAYRDLEHAEQLIQRSALPSLTVRPVTLLLGKPSGKAKPSEAYTLFSTIRRSDIATWIIENALSVNHEKANVLLAS
ncbi:MAG: NAD(P)H-binding protein [Bacteroidota bacterium]